MLWRILTIVPLAVVLLIGLLLATLWLEHTLPLELPRPSGPYAAGRTGTVWEDTTRMDPFDPKRGRELVVWIWYPAQPSNGEQTAEYMPGRLRRALAGYSGVLLAHFLMRDPAKVRSHSLEAPAVATAGAPYPLIIFRSGIGALALDYSTLAEDLASHGYIVVGADTPYSTSVVAMPDGRVIHKTVEGNPGEAPIPEAERERLAQALIKIWTADTRLLLDQVTRLNENDPVGRFTGKINLGAVGLAGHSFGGATAAQFCHDDVRCRAGIDLDGQPFGSVVQEGMSQPFLFLLSDHGGSWTAPDCQICANIRSAAKRAPGDRLIATMLGAHHFSFSDLALAQSRILRWVLVALGGQGGLNPRAGLAATCRYVLEFFDTQLRGAPPGALYSNPQVPGIRFETK